MKKIFTLSFIILIFINTANSQEEFEMWYKLSPEIRLNIRKHHGNSGGDLTIILFFRSTTKKYFLQGEITLPEQIL